MKSLKEGQKYGFHPSLRKLSINPSLPTPNLPYIYLKSVTSLLATVVEDLELFDKFNCIDVCNL